MDATDLTEALQEQVTDAFQSGTALQVLGGSSKAFYGRAVEGEPLNVSGHSGIIQHDPSELVVTARAGTRLANVEQALSQHGQMFGCESPHFGDSATLGGMVAAGLSGPRRPFAGAVRDFVLGAKILNGRGELLRFGGQVMKNVAGYDLSRLMVGSNGCLGVLLEISIKVVPIPFSEATLKVAADQLEAIEQSQKLIGRGAPVSGAAHYDGFLYLRLSGGPSAVDKARRALRGDEADANFWDDLREHRLDFFHTEEDLWRVSVPATTPPLDIPGKWLTDWGGALRWLTTNAPATRVRALAARSDGHATRFRTRSGSGEIFQPLEPVLMALHQNLKKALDPAGILNPGRMYDGL